MDEEMTLIDWDLEPEQVDFQEPPPEKDFHSISPAIPDNELDGHWNPIIYGNKRMAEPVTLSRTWVMKC